MMKRVKRLLGVISEVKGLGLQLLLAGFSLPVLGFVFVLDVIDHLRARALEKRELSKATTRCPAGHEVSLLGGYACGGCGFVDDTHAWERCVCGARASRIQCPCGRSIQCPLPLDEEQP